MIFLLILINLFCLNIKVKITDQIKELDLNDYIATVVASEIPNSWDSENFKVMSILVRTYVLEKFKHRKYKTYVVRDSVLDQVYKPVKNIKDYNKIYKYVLSTDKYVLYNKNNLAKILYHSSCGGQTELPQNVWGGNNDYSYSSVICKHCKSAPNSNWSFKISKSKLASAFSSELKNAKTCDIKINEYTSTKRVKNVFIYTSDISKIIEAQTLREKLGFNKLKSTNFAIKLLDNDYYFSGKGWGHGVGLCQWGMNNLIKNGHNYKDVIKFYFPNFELKKVNYESL